MMMSRRQVYTADSEESRRRELRRSSQREVWLKVVARALTELTSDYSSGQLPYPPLPATSTRSTLDFINTAPFQ